MGKFGTFDWGAIRHAYLAGDYAACRELLQDAPEPQAQIWRARLDSRLGRVEDSLQRLIALKTDDERLAAERDIWLASAYAYSSDFVMSHRLLDRALRVLRPADEAYYRAHHIRALTYFFAHEYDAGWSAMSALLDSPNLNDRAQAYAYRSWTVAKREIGIRAQLADLVSSMEVYEQIEEPDQFTLVRTLYGLASLCREIATEGILERVRHNALRVRVNEATSFPFFQMTRVLGWADALQGDEVSAMRCWRDAQARAPSDFWRVFCLVDRAYLADAMGRKRAARETLSAADEQASRLSWSDTRDEERLILLTIAQLFAPHDPARAQRYLAIFRSLKTQADPRMGFLHDDRSRALQLYPQGTALLQLGEREDAIPMLKEAYDIFDRFEYGWRASLTALRLFEATNERKWLERAREQIAPWPKSWIARCV